MFIVSIFFYLFILLFLSFWISKRKKTSSWETFFLGGRSLSSWLIFFSLTATWFGAASTVATFQVAYKKGLSAMWILGIPTILTMLIFIILNTRLRSLDFTTLPNFLERSYGKPVMKVTAYITYFYMILLSASQMTAWGKLCPVNSKMSYEEAIIIGGLILIVYTSIGGYLSVVITDILQLLLLSLALIIMFLSFKAWEVNFIKTDFFFFKDFGKNILMTISFVLAWLVSPITWQRMISAKSAKKSRNGLLLSIVGFTVLYLMVILVAVSIRNYKVLDGNINSLINYFSLPLGVIIFLGLASSIFSTSDSALNIAAMTAAVDIKPLKDKDKSKIYYFGATFLSGLFVILISLRFTSIIKLLGLSSEFMVFGLFVPTFGAVFGVKKSYRAGLYAVTTGGVMALLSFMNSFWGLYESLFWPYSLPWGLLLSYLAFMIGRKIDLREQEENRKEGVV